MKAASDVNRCYPREDIGIRPKNPAAKALTSVSIDVNLLASHGLLTFI